MDIGYIYHKGVLVINGPRRSLSLIMTRNNMDSKCSKMQTQSEPDLRESQLAQREIRRGSFLSVQVGERHLPRLTDRCHESRVKFVYFRDKIWHDEECLPR
jgi:hypothetical protein